ncbi:amidohydrolase [Candidatus Bipolaricaulota bacterium]|nr:amidohydrolase [Candidatus Bipolaricaulota bacterium]
MNETVDARIATLAKAAEQQLVYDRRDFHKHAESGWTEFRTASLIAQRLTGLGYEVLSGRDVCSPEARMGLPPEDILESHWVRAQHESADPVFLESMRGGLNGVVGILRNGVGPVVGLRFDIDALDLAESEHPSHRPTAEGFASIHENVCHACGHDGHAAIGLGIASLMSELRSEIRGTVKLIFQPAEEGVRGARSMVAAGVVDDVDLLLGHHLVTGCSVGEIFPGMGGYAATRKMDITFHGAPAHAGGSPEGGHNALLAAANAVLNLYALPRHRNGFTRVNVGKMTAGSGRNVIPSQATLVAEVRGENTELCDSMYERAVAVIESAAAMYGCTSSIRAMGGAGTADSDELLARRVQTIASRIPGITFHTMEKMGGSEDFTEMMNRVQANGGQATNIGIGADFHGTHYQDANREKVLAAHTGSYDIDEGALAFATRLMTTVVFDLMKYPKVT